MKTDFTNWKLRFEKFRPPHPNGAWVIKVDNSTETPVVDLPEPLGGKKDDEGFNQYNKSNAKLIAAAPELLEACIEALKMYDKIQPTGGYQYVRDSLEGSIKKAVE